MKIQISPDARPQVRTLLLATLITLALWFIPYADILTYPFRIFVTFIHEGGHALAALLTGGSVMSLSVHTDASGLTVSTKGGLLSQFIVSSAGYVGAMTFGVLLLFLIRRAVAARIVLTGSAVFILLLTFIFGVGMPIYNTLDPNVQFSGIPFTVVSGVVLSATLIALARFASARVATFFVSFLAVQCVLNAVLDLKNLFFMSSPFAAEAHTDAVNMANATGVPSMFWAILWIGVSLALLSMAMRFYAISKHPPKQQDLPFDEPLDI
ncbi:MAG TPA: M50 family metallopeptidase [Pyrinomonadaceae bacterium]|nr:M50 family metallopeptidase [Pyrinomonadaceae bacterium]